MQALPAQEAAENGFGTAVRVPLTGFMVFGLVSFWAYTAWRLGTLARAHFASRWEEVRPRLEAAGIAGERLEALRRQGYPAGGAAPAAAAAMFAASGLVVAGWFWRWVIAEAEVAFAYAKIMLVVGVSAALFYGAACVLALWLARALFRHETVELLVQERGAGAVQRAAAPTAALVARWEHWNNHVALFLILALAMVATPVAGAHLFVSGASAAYVQGIGVLCFALAALFHFWGVKLLVGLYNAHLATEAAHAGRAPPAAAPAAAGLEPDEGAAPFIFVSYKRDDLARIAPVLERIRAGGYRLWYDKGIPGGAEWDALIEKKLKGCAALVYFVSRGSVDSKYCRREVKYVDQLGKPIVSVRLEPAELAHGLEMLLTQYQMIDAASPDFAGEIERALKYLRVS